MRWHQLWRTKIEASVSGHVITITAHEHEGRQHRIIFQRDELAELLGAPRPELPARDGDQLVAWLREGADELEKAHVILDQAEVPRSLPGADVECTLAARIQLLADRATDAEQGVYDQGERS